MHIKNDDYEKAFDVAVAAGINAALARGLALLVPVSIPAVIGLTLVSVVASYFLSEDLVAEARHFLQNEYKKSNNTINSEKGCKNK